MSTTRNDTNTNSKNIEANADCESGNHLTNQDHGTANLGFNLSRTKPGNKQETNDNSNTNPIDKNQIQAEIHKRRGRELFDKEDYQGALSEIKEALRLCPSSDFYLRLCGYIQSIIHLKHGDVLFKQKDYQGAIDEANKSLLLYPNLANAYILRGNCYKRIGEPKKALEDYERAAKLEADKYLPDVNRERNKLQAEFHFKQAQDLYSRRNYSDALSEINKALSLISDSVRLAANFYAFRGDCYYKLAEPKKAFDDYDQAAKLDPSHFHHLQKMYNQIQSDSYRTLGEDLYDKGDYQGALERANEAIRLATKSSALAAHAYVLRGNCYRKIGEPKKASEDYIEAGKLDPENYSLFIHMAHSYRTLSEDLYNKGDYQGALERANEAIRLATKSSALVAHDYALRGNCYRKIGEPKKALEDYIEAGKLDPENYSPFIHIVHTRKEKTVYVGQVIEHFNQHLAIHPAQHEVIIGADHKTVLKLLFDKEGDAQNIVDHLFQYPYYIGSTTNGANRKKAVQKADNNHWAVFIREDQLQEYYIKTILSETRLSLNIAKPQLQGHYKKLRPFIIIEDLNEFLEAFSLKQHIYQVMAEEYPDHHAKGAIVRYKIINQNQNQTLRISIQNNEQYAHDLLAYFKKRISMPIMPSILTENGFFHIDLFQYEFFAYVCEVQINGIYYHHTLDALFQNLLQKTQFDEKNEQEKYEKLLLLAVKKWLGKYCYSVSAQNFHPQQITLSLIEAYLQHNLKLTKHQRSCVDVECILEDKLENIMQKGRLLYKVVNRAEREPDYGFYFILKRMSDPGNQRTMRGSGKNKTNFWFFPEVHTVERNRSQKYNPQIKTWYQNQNIAERGRPKLAKLHSKRTASTLSLAEIGATKRLDHQQPPSGIPKVLLLFDIAECEVHSQYTFYMDSGTDYEWWYGVPPNFDLRLITTLNYPDYFSTVSARAITLVDLKNKNQRLYQEWIETKQTYYYNELLAGLPKKQLRGIGARADTLLDRLTALAAAYEAKLKFGLDYNIPILITPSGDAHKKYPYDQRIKDVLDALDNNNPNYPSRTILLSLLKELYSCKSKILDPILLTQASNVCTKLNIVSDNNNLAHPRPRI